MIGVTGGIATGKSTVLEELKAVGAYVIDADKVGHRAYSFAISLMELRK